MTTHTIRPRFQPSRITTAWPVLLRPVGRLLLAACCLAVPVACQTPPAPSQPQNPPPPASADADPPAAGLPVADEKELLAQAQRYEQLRQPQPLPPADPSTATAAHTPAPSTPAPSTTAPIPPEPAPAPPRPAVQQPPAPPAAPPPLTRRQLTEKLAGLLNRQMSGSAALRPYLQRAALTVIDGRYELTETDLAALSPTDRRIVLDYQRLFAQLGRELGHDDTDDHELLYDAAQTLADQLARTQPLHIRTMRLCRRVKGYGVYDELPGRTFLAGREHPVIVYAELEHFTTTLDENGQHVVRLSQELVLYNESDGLAVWRQPPVPVVDVSRNRRRDFFVVQIIRLSSRLTVGKYRLKLSITDQQGRQVDQATVPIEIVADPRLTAPAPATP